MLKNILSPATLLALSALACPQQPAANARSPLLPRDGDVVTVHQTTLLNPYATPADGSEAAQSGALPVWDFSNSEIIDANQQWRYYNHADTMFMEVRPHVRRDYAVAADTVKLICTETWCQRMGAEGPSAPYSFTGAETVRFDERGRRHQSDSIWGDALARVEPPVSGTLMLPDGVTIENATMTHRRYVSVRSMGPASLPRDTANATSWLHTEDVITWQAPGLRYEVAETRVVTDSIPGYPATSAWESYICPPETQPLESPEQNMLYTPATAAPRPASVNPATSPAPGSEATDGPSGWLANNVITASGTADGIALSGTAPEQGNVGFMLCDVMGRVYSHLPTRSYSEGENIDAMLPRPAGLQPGDYLLRIVTPGGSVTQKLILR